MSIDTSKLPAHDLAGKVTDCMFGDDNSAAVGAELAKDIRGSRNLGIEPTCEELAAYILRAIGSLESVAPYLEYKLESECGEED